jgi:hypothetical protein
MGDRWTFVNILPRSGFIHTAHHGKRTKEEAEQFVKTIKSHSDGAAPLFLSDGWKSYQEVLETTYSHEGYPLKAGHLYTATVSCI